MNIITGFKNSAHITAAQDGLINAGILGEGCYILPVGSMLAPTVDSNTQVTIADGILVMQGRAACIETSEALTISNPTQGKERIDLICAKYAKAGNGTESITLVVKTGTAATTNPTPPSYTSGNILDGDSTVEVPLYKVENHLGTGGSMMVSTIAASEASTWGISEYFTLQSNRNIDEMQKSLLEVRERAYDDIGTYKSNTLGSSLTVTNNSNTSILALSLEPGVWVINGRAMFPSNATGFRQICVGPTEDDIDQPSRMIYKANDGIATYVQTTRVYKATSTTLMRLTVRQSSGQSLTLAASAYNAIIAVKVG